MIVTPATLDDVWWVLSHMDPRHQAELNLAGLTWGALMAKAEEWLGRDGGDTLRLDGVPACVLGFDGAYTWFIATPAYYAGGLPVLRHAKRYWAAKAEERGEILTVATSAHPDIKRWFTLLGFEHVERSRPTLFRLVSTSRKNQAKNVPRT